MLKNIEFNDFLSFKVLGENISVVSTDTDYGLNTVAEINDSIVYLGNIEADILAAVLAYQHVYQKFLSDKEFDQTLKDNNL